jgi:sec-independent protein translocase protein TatB
MFEVGFTELLLIFALALIVLGPEKLPKLAQQVGRWVGRARAMARQFREQLEEEATNLERKFDVDPGIDTSLESKPAPAPEAAAPQSPEPTEEFYPPDHHMHSSNRAAVATDHASDHPATDNGATPAPDGAQTELDLTTQRDDGSRPAP